MKPWRVFFIFPLLLFIPFGYFLHFNHYWFFQKEIVIISSILCLCGLLAAGIYQVSTWWLKILWLAVWITLAMSFLPAIQSDWALVSIFLTCLVLGTCLRENFLVILMTCTLVFIAANTLLPIQHPAIFYRPDLHTPPKNLPPVIDIILDEHAGMAGMPAELTDIRQQLQGFYLQQGFKLYSHAYSHYAHTVDAIPNLLNLTTRDQEFAFLKSRAQNYFLTQNLYFKILARQGYAIRVYESDNIDYCRSNGVSIASCYVYPIAPLNYMNSIELPVWQKVQFILKYFLIESFAYRSLVNTYQFELAPSLNKLGWQLPPWPWYQSRLNSLPFLATMARLQHDIVQQPAGTVFFAHILTPHSPYIFDENCHMVNSIEQWELNIGPDPLVNTIATRLQRYHFYGRQLQCVQKQLQQLFTAMKQAGIYDRAFIVVHSDHGSRITLHNPAIRQRKTITKQDLADCYAALFAIKLPFGKPSIDTQLLPLEVLQAQVIKLITGIDFGIKATAAYVDLLPPEGNQQMRRMSLHGFEG